MAGFILVHEVCVHLLLIQQAGTAADFDTADLSCDYGFRKPDRRLFKAALSKLEIESENVIFVGNDMYRDIFGARQLGIKTVFFRPTKADIK